MCVKFVLDPILLITLFINWKEINYDNIIALLSRTIMLVHQSGIKISFMKTRKCARRHFESFLNNLI